MNPDELAAFEAYVRSRGRGLTLSAHLLTGDRGHAEDLAQLTLERLARHWHRVERDPDRYARRTLVNLANDRWRRLGRRVRESSAPVELASRDAAGEVELRHDLVAALRELPPRQRTALVLRYFADLSEEDAAAAMGCSVGTVKSTTSRGLANLRALPAFSERSGS